MTLLQARDVIRSYGRTPALRGVTLEVAEGEVLAVTGPSGSGKSTLLHCLAGIIRPESGEVTYAGRRIDALSETERSRLRRSDFGVLFQFGQLVGELSAAENVALPLLLGGRTRGEAHAVAMDELERLGVADVADARPGETSGGQQQRIAAARALVTKPKVLFADEPTGALDALSGEHLLGELVQSVRKDGMTVVLVTHEPSVAAYADREVVLRDGTVDSTGLGADRLGARP
jgi:putative ABC transport system ATP-binding protein